MIGAGKVIALLTYAQLWRNGCDCWALKATGSCVVQSAGSQHIQNYFYSAQTKSSDWTTLISPSANSFFPVLSTSKLHCSSNLRCEKEDMIYCHNYRPAISLRILWRRKITAPYWENRYAENEATAQKLFWSLWQSIKWTHWGGTKKILTRVRWTFSTKLVVSERLRLVTTSVFPRSIPAMLKSVSEKVLKSRVYLFIFLIYFVLRNILVLKI